MPAKKGRSTSKRNPCPCCNNTHGCRVLEDGAVFCLRLTAHDKPTGYFFVKELGKGMGSLFLPDSRRQSVERSWQDEIEKRLKKRQREQERQRYLKKLLSAGDRDRHYRRILNTLELSDAHREVLRQRGLDDRMIDKQIFRSWVPGRRIVGLNPLLPGVDSRGDRLTGARGIFLPAYDPNGRIVGGQLKTDSGRPKYLWLSSSTDDGAGPQLPNNELPLFVYRPSRLRSKRIGLCEGALKAAIAAELTGQVFIGAAGGWFGPETLRSYLEQLAFQLQSREVLLYPDAGAVTNTAQVPFNNQHVIQLVQSWGFDLKVAWWGQTSKESTLDIDELLTRADYVPPIRYITPEAFLELHPVQIRRKLAPHLPHQAGLHLSEFPAPDPDRPLSQRPIDYEPGDRLSTWQHLVLEGHRLILDASEMGTGKSYDSGKIDPTHFGVEQVVYLSNDHRNVTTPTLAEWADLQGRHGGLQEIAGPGGTRQKRRAKKGETNVSVPPNCDRHTLAELLPTRNVPATGEYLCPGCPHLTNCRSGIGSYTYLADRKQVLSQSRFRAHIESLDLESLAESTLLVIDEAGRLPMTRSFLVTRQDIERTMVDLETYHPPEWEKLAPFLRALRQLLAEKLPLHGLTHEAVLSKLPELPSLTVEEIERISYQGLEFMVNAPDGETPLSDLPPEIRHRFKQDVTKLTEQAQTAIALRWLPELFRTIAGEGRLRLNSGGLTITIRNDRVIELLKHPKIKAVILLDASEAPEVFERWLDEPVHTIRQRPPHPLKSATLRVVQVGDLGLLGTTRGKEQQRRVRAVIEGLQAKHPGLMVIESSEFAKVGDGYWYRDSRGSNAFQSAEAIVLVGPPIPNIASVTDEFALLARRHPSPDTQLRSYPVQVAAIAAGGPWWVRTMLESADPDLAAFIRHRTLAEITQAIGRLRASRRPGQQLTVYFLSDYPLDRPVELVKAGDIVPEARSRREVTLARIEAAIAQLEADGKPLTQEAIARMAGISQGEVSKTMSEVEAQWYDSIPNLLDPISIRHEDRSLSEAEVNTLVKMLESVRSQEELVQFRQLSPTQKHQVWRQASSELRQRIRSLQVNNV